MATRARAGWAAACSLLGLFLHYGCSATDDDPAQAASGSPGAASGTGAGGAGECGGCFGTSFQSCNDDGSPGASVECAPKTCVPELGCRTCNPGGKTCVGNDVHECNEDGEPGALVSSCDPGAGEICHDGVCTSACVLAEGTASNVGCEFWAVDLPNERGLNDAAAAQWGIVLANAGQVTAEVTIEQNQAAYGEPVSTTVVTTLTLAAGQLAPVALPRAEVTGWTPMTADPPGPPGTWLSSAAFRVTSTAPVVVYQFNVFTNSYANDASLLLPRNGLGTLYRVLGYPTANPIDGGFSFAGIPDRTSVTIVGVAPSTTVKVKTSAPTVGDGLDIPAMAAGGETSVVLGPFDVLNLSTDGLPGDLTGTVVEADQPVAVFTSGERIGAPYSTEPPPPPDYDPNSLCCTDHFEEQLFPVTSMGKQFVITRSPPRSEGFMEADELRFLGIAAPADVKTNLPPPLDAFTLAPGQLVETWSDKDVVVEASEPIAVGQVLLSAGYTTKYIGDPSLTIFPPVEQHRGTYLFLVPPSWTENYFVLAAIEGQSVLLDGAALPAGCVQATAGTADGKTYQATRCPVTEGVHRLEGAEPFGLTVYGYGPVGSYAFAGGADVVPIYEPPPID